MHTTPARRKVGDDNMWDLQSGSQFAHLMALGLRENHRLLDIGCGSLRAGRMFIMYLDPGRYYGIEPDIYLLRDGLLYEVGGLASIKVPTFDHNYAFDLDCFGLKFDFILAQSVFTHLMKEQIRSCFESVAEVLEPNGILAATYKKGVVDWTGGYTYPGCVDYTEAFIQGVVEGAGLTFHSSNWEHCVQNGHRWFYATKGREIHQQWKWTI